MEYINEPMNIHISILGTFQTHGYLNILIKLSARIWFWNIAKKTPVSVLLRYY